VLLYVTVELVYVIVSLIAAYDTV